MSTAQHSGNTAAGAMLQGALPPTLAVSGAGVLISWLVAGPTGMWGALLGAGLVVVSFSLSLVALGATRRLDPALTLLIALALYAAKVVALAVGLIAVAQAGLIGDPFHRTALAGAVIACTVTWTTFEIVASVKHREPLYDLGKSAP